ncbi:hypothetical protein C5S31_06605 [ANME-1 cluster archaeon GoMg2]|nr:hypothetical protein [ANME-1 cluster archaeon GoMg2]
MRYIGFISEKHGAAVAFLPSDKESMEIREVADRIESIFPKDPNTRNTLLQIEVGPHTTFTSVWGIDANLALEKTHFLQRKKEIVILSKGLKLSVDEDSTYIIEDRLILKGSNSPEKWSHDVAIKDAFNEIIRTLINKERKGFVPQKPLADLANKIETFKTMIKSPGIMEIELQKYFEANPEFLHFGSIYKKIYPQILLKGTNGDLKPDFFLERVADGYSDILDIKLPDKNLIVGKPTRIKFSSHVESSIAQVDEYREFFDDPKNRKQIERKYGIKIYKPTIFVLIGIDESPQERIKINSRYSSKIKIITYDHILRCMEQFLESLQKYAPFVTTHNSG